MGRIIGGALVGYVAMSGFVFATLTGAYVALGTERAFQPGSYDVSTLWISVMMAVSVGAALFGGYVAARVAKSVQGANALSGFVLFFGLILAIPVLQGLPDPGPRFADVPAMEAMTQARQPTWIALLLPMIGAAGAWFGGSLAGVRPGQPQGGEEAGVKP